MPKPGEHKTVQSRILKYAQEIGRTFVQQEEAERRRGFTSQTGPHPNPLPEGEGIKDKLLQGEGIKSVLPEGEVEIRLRQNS